SKPIDIRELNTIMNTYVRDRNIDEHNKFKKNNFVKTEQTSVDMEKKLIEISQKDIKNTINFLKEKSPKENLKLFTTTVHGVKSVLASIGEEVASEKAAELENAGLDECLDFISEHIDDFINLLESILLKFCNEEIVYEEDELINEDTVFLLEQLNIIKEASENFDDAKIFEALEKLKTKSWQKETLNTIDKINDNLYLHSDFDQIIVDVEDLIKQYL
ncbi:MAG: hypothetical protein FWG98_10345, partial [Candidatus Cloacimonetes bacterium]|nr:hypothetical protein [Candidatus Cloacimonadota bacterium]